MQEPNTRKKLSLKLSAAGFQNVEPTLLHMAAIVCICFALLRVFVLAYSRTNGRNVDLLLLLHMAALVCMCFALLRGFVLAYSRTTGRHLWSLFVTILAMKRDSPHLHFCSTQRTARHHLLLPAAALFSHVSVQPY